MGGLGSSLRDATGTGPRCKQPPFLCALPQGPLVPPPPPQHCQPHIRVWKGIRAPGTGPTPPEGLRDPVPVNPAGTRALDFIVRETKSLCGRHSRPWGDKGASCLSFCHLPRSDKAQHLLVLGGQDKFRCGGFRTSGDLFAAVALRRDRAAWLICPVFRVLASPLHQDQQPLEGKGVGFPVSRVSSGACEMLSLEVLRLGYP